MRLSLCCGVTAGAAGGAIAGASGTGPCAISVVAAQPNRNASTAVWRSTEASRTAANSRLTISGSAAEPATLFDGGRARRCYIRSGVRMLLHEAHDESRECLAWSERVGTSCWAEIHSANTWRGAPLRVKKLILILVDSAGYPARPISMPIAFHSARLPVPGWTLRNTAKEGAGNDHASGLSQGRGRR